ncbi:phage tail tube protein [Pseudoalteromonas umbrosa]|uniref:phage tail tube protein n=1 Tax=Pseudoalteromonas umbrosa TaxID=3048489 RepID=UPI0024C2E74E|nr:phage tail tube protein [Pseudoalteromonas sp. B95]MDK1289781.1 phage tail tube protein [Pseudoalteromonas sp. B95]
MAIKNREIKFLRHDGAAFALVGNITDIDGLTPTREVEESTHYGVESSSDDADSKTYERGLFDGGEVAVKVKYKVTGNEGAQAMENEFYDAGEGKADYQIQLPKTGNPTREFTGIVTSCSEPMTAGEDVMQEFKIKISGKIRRGTWS